jgi:hypothetical protein
MMKNEKPHYPKEGVHDMKRTMTITISCMVAVVATAVIAQDAQWVMPKQDGVGIYKNKVREKYAKPVATADKADRLQVVQESQRHYKVELPAEGTTGWVEKRLVAKTAKGKSYMFEEAKVMGYLDNPTPIAIIDAERADASIELDRSFEEALKENVDRNTIERQVD